MHMLWTSSISVRKEYRTLQRPLALQHPKERICDSVIQFSPCSIQGDLQDIRGDLQHLSAPIPLQAT